MFSFILVNNIIKKNSQLNATSSDLGATRSNIGVMQARMDSLQGFVDVLADENPKLESILEEGRTHFSVPQPQRTQKDEEELERRSQDFFQEAFRNNNP